MKMYYLYYSLNLFFFIDKLYIQNPNDTLAPKHTQGTQCKELVTSHP